MLGDVDGCVEQVGGRMGGVKSRTRSIPGMGVMNNLLRVDPEKRLSPSPTDLLQQQTMTFPLFLGVAKSKLSSTAQALTLYTRKFVECRVGNDWGFLTRHLSWWESCWTHPSFVFVVFLTTRARFPSSSVALLHTRIRPRNHGFHSFPFAKPKLDHALLHQSSRRLGQYHNTSTPARFPIEYESTMYSDPSRSFQSFSPGGQGGSSGEWDRTGV